MAKCKAGKSICFGEREKASYWATLPWCGLWLGLFLLFCLRPVLILFHHVPLDYNEGWGAFLSSWALGGVHKLYSSSDGFVFNNYPPVFFIILGNMSRLTGFDSIVVGRIISCLSVLAAGWLISFIVCSVTGRRSVALAAGSIFLVTASTAFYSYFGMNDPQWLAQAIMLAALAVILSKNVEHISYGRLFFGALLVVVGGFTKHNLVAMPFALTIWLFCHDWRKGCFWAVTLLLLVLVGLALCDVAYGWSFFQDVFLHKRVVRLSRFAHGLRVLPMMGGIVVVAIGGACYRRDYNSLFFLFLALGLVLGEVESLGEGVDYNCMFDALVAGSILCGIVLTGLKERAHVTLACLVMSLPLLVLVPWRGETIHKELAALPAQDHLWQENISFLRPYNTSLLCVDMALCHWAGGRDAIDVFNLGQALKEGRDTFLVHSDVMHHKFAFIQLSGESTHYGSGINVFDAWVKDAGYRFLAANGHGVVIMKAP